MTTRNVNLVGSEDSEFQKHSFLSFFTHGYHTHVLSLSAIAAIADVDLATSHDLVRDLLCSQYEMNSNIFLIDARSFIGHAKSPRS
ncbi:hypothetical protein BDD21_4177 [Thiocapsa rosea]|uniref:Uncharacterized protein n=1 Tax=Thiocapsa rosea TaxID=69360 RepID=A0A495VFP6_9GAMM|nr:hypothetical protein BDD21_4177 [Thiocapsa rosea]